MNKKKVMAKHSENLHEEKLKDINNDNKIAHCVI